MSSFSEMRISWAATSTKWGTTLVFPTENVPGHAATLLRANGVGNGGLYEAVEQRAGGDFGFLRMSTAASNPPAAYGSRVFAPLLESGRRERFRVPRWL